MAALKIQTDKVSKLNQLDFTENRTICEQNGENENKIKLVLQRRIKNGKHRIFLVGYAYKNDELVKCSVLGLHTPDKRGIDTILSSCSCYTFCGMYELITS